MDNDNEKNKHSYSPREIAYLALLAASKEENYIAEILDKWIRETCPAPRDAGLAREIAYGACRMALALDAVAAQYTTTGKLSLKTKEKALLRTALYQHFYLERIPLYAICNETLTIARRYCHPQFLKFLNALLRKLEGATSQLPEGNTIEALSTRYSYPPFFIQTLLNAYGLNETIGILSAGNQAAPTMLRLRSKHAIKDWPSSAYSNVENTNNNIVILHDSQLLSAAAASPNVYIQNATPFTLMSFLKSGSRDFHRILDICASPGGKLLLAHDFFPKAKLYGNDLSPQKIEILKQNIDKFEMNVTLSCGPGENFEATQKFDLIILDVPCSNTGVLNKRPEARWRLSKQQIAQTIETQKKLLKHAASLLSPDGEIWYLTCSILPGENEELVSAMSKHLNLNIRKMQTQLPNAAGFDGGFACALH